MTTEALPSVIMMSKDAVCVFRNGCSSASGFYSSAQSSSSFPDAVFPTSVTFNPLSHDWRAGLSWCWNGAGSHLCPHREEMETMHLLRVAKTLVSWSFRFPDLYRLLLKEEGVLGSGKHGPVPTALRRVVFIKLKVLSDRLRRYDHMFSGCFQALCRCNPWIIQKRHSMCVYCMKKPGYRWQLNSVSIEFKGLQRSFLLDEQFCIIVTAESF